MIKRFALAALMVATSGLAQELREPTKVTLKHSNVPPKQVFDELAKQANTEFLTLPAKMFDRNPGQPISVEVENIPFWLAMREACAKSNISLKHATDSAKPTIILTRDNQDWTSYPAVSSGPFLVSLIGLHRASTVDMRKPADVQRTFYAKFTVFTEPRVRLLRGSLYAKVEDATDDKGQSLVPKEQDIPMNFVTSWVYNLEGKLEYPATPGKKIPKLRCSANFVAQTASETIEIDDPVGQKDMARTVAGRNITVKEIRRGAEEWEAVVTFAKGELSAEQWAAALFPGNSLRLVDGQNQSIVARGFGLGGKGEQATFVFKFEKDGPRGAKIGKPAKLVWEIPTATQQIPLTFEFTDVTIP
jgi:hypothetical protein